MRKVLAAALGTARLVGRVLVEALALFESVTAVLAAILVDRHVQPRRKVRMMIGPAFASGAEARGVRSGLSDGAGGRYLTSRKRHGLQHEAGERPCAR